MTLAVSHDFDFGRIIVVILFLLGGFAQWLVKLWKENTTRPGETDLSTAKKIGEFKARRKAWLKQTGQATTPEDNFVSEAPTPKISEVRPSEKNIIIPDLPAHTDLPQRSLKISVPSVDLLPVRRIHPLMEQMAGYGGLKRAIVLNEVLGPPKALQNEP